MAATRRVNPDPSGGAATLATVLERGLPGRTKPFLLGHRGNSAACPENTMAAFRRALDDGVDLLETDLRLTADGVLVCLHDPTVDRTTDGTGPVSEKTLAEVRRLSASCGRAEFATERVPELAELLEITPPDCGLALELKDRRFAETATCRQLADQVIEAGLAERTMFISFEPARLAALHATAPELPVGLLTMAGLRPRAGYRFLGPLWPMLLANPLFVWWAHRRGQVVAPIDPTPGRRLALYRRLGCDAVMANDTAAAARALGIRPRAARTADDEPHPARSAGRS